jgi:hypothetical protein
VVPQAWSCEQHVSPSRQVCPLAQQTPLQTRVVQHWPPMTLALGQQEPLMQVCPLGQQVAVTPEPQA